MVSQDCRQLRGVTKLQRPVTIKFADAHTVQATEIGELKLGKATLKNVLRLDIRTNLLSARMLAKDHGIISVFRAEGGTFLFPDKQALDFEVDKETGLYVLRIGSEGETIHTESNEKAFLTQTTLSDQELHELFGHASSQTLSKLFNREIHLKSCDACARGKMKQKQHFRRYTRETRLLDTMHSDIVHAGVRSIEGALYFCTVMDEASKHLWIILLRSTQHLHELLIPLIRKEQKKLGMDVCKLTTDGGTEYASKSMEKFLLNEGIEHCTKPRYDHAANGTIENCNQRVTLIAATILLASNLSLAFWSYAVEYACLLYNCLPTSSLNWSTPHEALYGYKFDTKKLILFGSKAMIFLPKEIRKDGKFSDKAAVGILLGYNKTNNAYHVYLPEENRFLESQTIQTGYGLCSKEELKKWKISRDDDASLDDDEAYLPDDSDTEQQGVVQAINRGHLQRKSKQEANDKLNQLQTESMLLAKALPHPLNEDWEHEPTASSHPEEPKGVKEALISTEWRASMQKEMNALKEFQTWELIPPEAVGRRKIHRCNWVFKRKDDGTAKSRLTFDGSTQAVGDVYSCVGSKVALRALFKIIVQHSLEAKHIDISNAFVHGKLEPEEYVVMQQPPGFKEKGKEIWLCLVKKNLYGLRQAPKVWAELLNNSLREYGLEQSTSDPCLWIGKGIILYVYVDDMISASRDNRKLEDFFAFIQRHFVAKDLGFPRRVLGIEIERRLGSDGRRSILMHQHSYCEQLLERFSSKESKIVRSTPIERILTSEEIDGEFLSEPGIKLYQRIVGSILYLAVCTRPDLTYSSSILSKYCTAPRKGHFAAAQRVLEYLRGTKNLGLQYFQDCDDELNAFSDSDHCSETDRLSRNGYILYWGTSPIVWGSKKYTSAVPLSSAESEFYAATLSGTNALHLRNMIQELKTMKALNHELSKTLPAVNLWIDNLSCIKVLNREGFECGTKHIDIRHMWIKQEVKCKRIKVDYVPTKDQPADVLTKPLSKNLFLYQAKLLGLRTVLPLGGNE
jgi:hypothetical protein